MVRQFAPAIKFVLTILTASLVFCLPQSDCWGRGGGRGGGGGGGFSGGVSRGGGGFSRGARPSPSFSGGARPSPGFSGGARPSTGMGVGGSAGFGGGAPGAGIGVGGPAGVGGRARPGAGIGVGGAAGIGGGRPGAGVGVGGAAGIGGGARPGAGLGGPAAGGLAAPNRGQLDSFLGLPSDQGLGSLSTRASTGASQLPAAGGNFEVKKGTAEGPRGGQVGGITVTGPGGNTAGRVVGVGAQGGVAAVGGVQGANGGVAGRGVAVGPGGQAVAGRGAVGPGGYGRGGVVTAGPAGVGAGFARVTPSGRYTAAAAVRGNYNHWGVYGRGWYAQYPGAWVAAGLTANAIWNTATWGTASTYCGYSEQPPVYYDYGTSVVYEGENVYVNGDDAGTAEQYYNQASTIAAAGAQADAGADADWLPLGVFAFTKPEDPKSDITIQLAINKQAILRGNYTDNATNTNQVIQGSLDKQTQRVSFTVGDDKTNIVETGLYNLTKDEAPCIIHFGPERTEQWLLVRLKNEEGATGQATP